MKAYESIKGPLAFSISSIRHQQPTEARMRGYEDLLDKTLQGSFIREGTLNTMYTAVDKYLPKLHGHLRTKVKPLRYDNGLSRYGICVSLGMCGMSFTIKDCETYIQQHFRSFPTDLYDMTRQTIDEHWVDCPDHTGKQSRAFCRSPARIKQSRIIANYGNTLSNITMVVYKLGCTYHGVLVGDERPLNRGYCMLPAEAVSTFNENIIYRALISDTDRKSRLFLIDTQLSALCQNICDIITHYTFEESVFRQCEEGLMFTSGLIQLALGAEKKCLKGGSDPNWLHPYRWITKMHYYIPDIAFYNFLYTLDALFSGGLYVMHEKEKEVLLLEYRILLEASTTHTVEETAAIAGIGLENAAFWEIPLESITRRMDEFPILAKKAAQNRG